MATNIFLGYPPENIKQFIIENYSEPVDMTKVPLHFTANEPNSTIQLHLNDPYGAGAWMRLCYSIDEMKTWNEYRLEQIIELDYCKNKTVYMKALFNNDDNDINMSGFTRERSKYYYNFIMSGSVKSNGNIQYLIDTTGTINNVPNNYCYANLFENCSALTQSPLLPATTLESYCYSEMFKNCTSLSTIQSNLPATILKTECYYSMFEGCTSLINAPELMATTLDSNSCSYMFRNCINLNNINVNFVDWQSDKMPTTEWLYNTSSIGTFRCPKDLQERIGSPDYIPQNWTVIHK